MKPTHWLVAFATALAITSVGAQQGTAQEHREVVALVSNADWNIANHSTPPPGPDNPPCQQAMVQAPPRPDPFDVQYSATLKTASGEIIPVGQQKSEEHPVMLSRLKPSDCAVLNQKPIVISNIVPPIEFADPPVFEQVALTLNYDLHPDTESAAVNVDTNIGKSIFSLTESDLGLPPSYETYVVPAEPAVTSAVSLFDASD